MDYDWDVFLSYLHERPSGIWVNEHFLPYFKFDLGNALNRRARIFIDREGIHSGQKWPARIKHALARSRCLVGIWTPLYFQSEWCLNECAVMLHREGRLGYGTNQNPDGLTVGVKVNDGKSFPVYAKESQYADFEPFFFDGPAFLQSPLHLEFQQAIKPLAADVARVIQTVPAWSAEWESDPWLEDVLRAVQLPTAPQIPQPLIA